MVLCKDVTWLVFWRVTVICRYVVDLNAQPAQFLILVKDDFSLWECLLLCARAWRHTVRLVRVIVKL